MSGLKIYDSISELKDLSKKDISKIIDQRASDIIESGAAEISFAWLKKAEELLIGLKKKINDSAKEQILKGNDYSFGIKMKIVSRKDYYFDHDTTWNNLKNALKEHEELMKALKEPIEKVDENGEVTIIHNAYVKYIDSIKCEF